MADQRGGYHHGDLPRALLAATGDLIAAEGVGAVSIRAVARRVGVSHAAPAHHFGDRTGLVTAFAKEGFASFGAALAAARAGGGSPEERLRRCGRAYLDFARTERAHFAVLFRPELYDPGDAELTEVANAAFDVLVATVGDCLAAPDADEAARLALSAWVTVHGLAALLLDGPLAELGEAMPAPDDLADSVLGVLLAGLRAQPSWAGDARGDGTAEV